jgi:tRNA(adenine34) deaminase
MKNHDNYMREALKEAETAYKKGEIPIGAVVVCDGNIIARAHNEREEANLVTSHAEILALQRANQELESWRLDSCSLYVTIEPCPMCAGAIIQSRIKQVIYGASDVKTGAHKSTIKLFDIPFNHKVEIIHGVLENECSNLMKDFFKDLRVK